MGIAPLKLGALVGTRSTPFTVPLSIATQTIGILGQRGSGKSNTEVRMAEVFHAAGIPWVAVDPKGDWYGIRSSRDGNGQGLAIVVLGGLHGDVPIATHEGAQWADVICDHNITAVIDVSDFTKGERARFLVDFFDRLYRRHRAEPTIRHVFMEEAHEYIPQAVGREDGRLKDSASRIVLMGRSFGLGSSTCSQRSARLHKDVLTQIGTLVAHRTTGPQDRKAIELWTQEHDVSKELVASLPTLKDGEAWVWSPEFLGGVTRVMFDRRATFDSGATPEVGAILRAPKTLADVDLAAIKDAMGESIERAKANDPVELKRQLALAESLAASRGKELERARSLIDERDAALVDLARKADAPVRQFDNLYGLYDLRDAALEHLRDGIEAFGKLSAELDKLVPLSLPTATFTPADVHPVVFDPPAPTIKSGTTIKSVTSGSSVVLSGQGTGDPSASASDRKLLTALAQNGGNLSRNRLAALTGYKATSGGRYGNLLSGLRSRGWATGSDPLVITPTGLEALGAYEPLPTGRALIDQWIQKLPPSEAKLLATVVEQHPVPVPRDALAELNGYKPTSGGRYGNLLSALRTLHLIEGSSELRLSRELAEGL